MDALTIPQFLFTLGAILLLGLLTDAIGRLVLSVCFILLRVSSANILAPGSEVLRRALTRLPGTGSDWRCYPRRAPPSVWCWLRRISSRTIARRYWPSLSVQLSFLKLSDRCLHVWRCVKPGLNPARFIPVPPVPAPWRIPAAEDQDSFPPRHHQPSG